jgi:hypothetical protein
MKNITIILLTIFFTSCITQKKVNRWNNDHPIQAAGYCADNFPPDTITRTVTQNIDSAGYYDAYMNMAGLADSLFYRLDSLTHAATPEHPYKPNIDSIRKVVDAEIKRRLKPCVDTVKVVTNTVIDRAREKQLQGKLDEKDAIITARDKRISELEVQVKVLKKWCWYFWIAVALIGVYTFLKLRFKLPF